MGYTELQVTTNFSFLRGASHPDEMVEQAANYGYAEIGITDRNSLAGLVRAHIAAKAKGIRIIPACRLDILDGYSLLAYPANKDAYSQLSALLTKGNLRAEKGQCHLYKADVYAHAKNTKFIVIPPATLNHVFQFEPSFEQTMNEYKDVFGKDLYIAACRRYTGDDNKQLHCLSQLSTHLQIPLVATNDVHYHTVKRRQLQDLLTCIREKCTIHTAGFRLHPNAERYLKPAEEMLRLFRHYPDAIHRTTEIAEACKFSLSELKYEYPEELTTEGRTPQEELTYLTWQGAKKCFGDLLPANTVAIIKHELAFIEQMNYAKYFLTVYDIVRYARSQNILCQGRGSAANSTVCYSLGITSIDPVKFELLFERFISSARNEPPDIDVDFEHERREEVIQYIYQKYGRDRCAIVATVTQQHQKGALRDVAKAMGISIDTINRLTSSMWDSVTEWINEKQIAEHGLNLEDKHLRKTLSLTRQYMGFPRQLGQHTGGFVITQEKLSNLCPIMNARMENRTCIEWNKDDIDALGFLKIDVLALGMLTCIRKAFELASKHYNKEYTLANIPQDDKKVYEMISNADTIGVFQIESRAQQSMLPRLKPECFYDLVIEVAIVRPGPIQGDMVHPYLRRRNKEEDPDYPSKELEDILKRTLGVPLFQEQAMRIAMVAGGFTPSEADELRRSMATFKLQGMVTKFEKKLTEGMMKKGYSHEYAQKVFRQLEGFGSYGFPESHAASFALLVYVSSYLKCYYPDVFACALLNSMPMGFYQPAQIVMDAQKHGVEVRPVDINFSAWDNLLETENITPDNARAVGNYYPIRLGFRQAKGLREEEMNRLVAKRKQGYTSIPDLLNTGLSKSTLEKLADADAFRSIGMDRREALWEISACHDQPLGLFAGHSCADDAEKKVQLPAMSDSEHVVRDYETTALSLKAHPVSFIREKLDLLHIVPVNRLPEMKDGETVKVAGLVLVRQRPGTAKGVCFITIEDETGTSNLVVFENIFETFRRQVLQSRVLMAEGKLQIVGKVIHVIVQGCHDLSPLLRQLGAMKDNKRLIPLARADESISSIAPGNMNKLKKNQVTDVKEETLFPKGRNFK